MASNGSFVLKADAQGRPVTREPNILPLVQRIRVEIDDVFARYVGPISGELAHEAFEAWRAEGQVGPGGLPRYIARLARYIPQANQRQAFFMDASKCIQVSGAKS